MINARGAPGQLSGAVLDAVQSKCWMHTDAIAIDAGVTLITTRKYLRRLAAQGLIQRRRGPRMSGTIGARAFEWIRGEDLNAEDEDEAR